jgi:hypothetical protein
MFLLVAFIITAKGQLFQSSPQIFHGLDECQMALATNQRLLDGQMKNAKVSGISFEFKCLEWK